MKIENKIIILNYEEYRALLDKIEELKKICNDLFRQSDEKTREKFINRMKGNFDYL